MPEPNSMPPARNSRIRNASLRRPEGRTRTAKIATTASAPEEQPKTLAELNRAISAARPFVPGAMHAVLGEDPAGAAIAFVGEQPGDQEDLQGRPFVGPAGQLLNRAMSEAGIDRNRSYLTNAVKHFKFVQRGKHRIHQKPTAGEIRHYRWWLDKELALVRPRLIVALGATAVLALAGKSVPIARFRERGRFCWLGAGISRSIHLSSFASPGVMRSGGLTTNSSLTFGPSAPWRGHRSHDKPPHAELARLSRFTPPTQA